MQAETSLIRDPGSAKTFQDITVVSVNGHNDGRYAAEAITRTVLALPGSSGLLLSLAKPLNLPHFVRFAQIEPIDRVQYSFFTIYCLHYHIETDYALIVQEDGWALNGLNWLDDWFTFDYVGAPTHAASVEGRLMFGYSWVGRSRAVQVLNGGFSLRSRKLLEAPTRYAIGVKLAAQHPLLFNEDVQLCVVLRDKLEERGLKFCPVDVALTFSVEYMHPYLHGSLDYSRVFGHHAIHRKLRHDNIVEVDLTPDVINTLYGERQLLHQFHLYGYSLACRRRHE